MTYEILTAILASGGIWVCLENLVRYYVGRHDRKNDTLKIHGNALRGILYGELERRCASYISDGHISTAELSNLRTYYFEPYKQLGGDGLIDDMMARVASLPREEE